MDLRDSIGPQCIDQNEYDVRTPLCRPLGRHARGGGRGCVAPVKLMIFSQSCLHRCDIVRQEVIRDRTDEPIVTVDVPPQGVGTKAEDREQRDKTDQRHHRSTKQSPLGPGERDPCDHRRIHDGDDRDGCQKVGKGRRVIEAWIRTGCTKVLPDVPGEDQDHSEAAESAEKPADSRRELCRDEGPGQSSRTRTRPSHHVPPCTSTGSSAGRPRTTNWSSTGEASSFVGRVAQESSRDGADESEVLVRRCGRLSC